MTVRIKRPKAFQLRRDGTVRKRCARCGSVGWYRPRVAKCRQTTLSQFGTPSYWCYGDLTRVVRTRKVDLWLGPGVGLGAVLHEDYVPPANAKRSAYVATQRQAAARAVAVAQRQLARWRTKAKLAATKVRYYSRLVARAERAAGKPDARLVQEFDAYQRRLQLGAVRRRLAKAAGVAEPDPALI